MCVRAQLSGRKFCAFSAFGTVTENANFRGKDGFTRKTSKDGRDDDDDFNDEDNDNSVVYVSWIAKGFCLGKANSSPHSQFLLVC